MTDRTEMGVVADAAEALAALEVTTTDARGGDAPPRRDTSWVWPLMVLATLGAGIGFGIAGAGTGGTPGRGWWAVLSLTGIAACALGSWVVASAGVVRDGRAVVIGSAAVFASGVVLIAALPRAIDGIDQGLATISLAPLCLAVGLGFSLASNPLSRVVSIAARRSQVVLGIAVVPALTAIVVAVLDVHPGDAPGRLVVGLLGGGVAAIGAVVAAVESRRAPRLYIPAGLGLGLCAGGGLAAAFAAVGSGGAWAAGVLVTVAAGVACGGVLSGYSRGRRVAVAVESIIEWAPRDDLADHLGEAADTLVEAAGLGPGDTAEHTNRVIAHALGIARELDLPPARLRVISLGALFHDVGKIAIPDEVLNKPGSLTESERQMVEHHSLAGYQLASRLNVLWEAALAIRHHHEWVDGSGYPDGLRGDQIPIEARIIAVCDMFDALTTARPYREAMSPDDALVMMRAEAGTHLDRDCFDAFERMLGRRSGNVVSLPVRD